MLLPELDHALSSTSVQHCLLSSDSFPVTNVMLCGAQEVLDQVATELEQEEEQRAQHAREKKQVLLTALNCLCIAMQPSNASDVVRMTQGPELVGMIASIQLHLQHCTACVPAACMPHKRVLCLQ